MLRWKRTPRTAGRLGVRKEELHRRRECLPGAPDIARRRRRLRASQGSSRRTRWRGACRRRRSPGHNAAASRSLITTTRRSGGRHVGCLQRSASGDRHADGLEVVVGDEADDRAWAGTGAGCLSLPRSCVESVMLPTNGMPACRRRELHAVRAPQWRQDAPVRVRHQRRRFRSGPPAVTRRAVMTACALNPSGTCRKLVGAAESSPVPISSTTVIAVSTTTIGVRSRLRPPPIDAVRPPSRSEPWRSAARRAHRRRQAESAIAARTVTASANSKHFELQSRPRAAAAG